MRRTTCVVLACIALVLVHTGCNGPVVREGPEAGKLFTTAKQPPEIKKAPSIPVQPTPRPKPPAVEATVLDNVEATILDNFDKEFLWARQEDWGDEAAVKAMPHKSGEKDLVMDIQYKLGETKKVVVGRDLKEPNDLSKYNAILLDIDSKLPVGCLMAVGLMAMSGKRYVEGPPVYVRPGVNSAVVFRLDVPKFKSEESKWEYSRPAGDLSGVQKVLLLIYPIVDGRIQVNNLRLAKVVFPK